MITDIDRDHLHQALEKAQITDFRFHDFRHTWASWHIQNGTPLMVLKELGGWETLEMVQKYAHLNPSHLLNYANHVKFTSNSFLDTSKLEAENEILGNISDKKKAVIY